MGGSVPANRAGLDLLAGGHSEGVAHSDNPVYDLIIIKIRMHISENYLGRKGRGAAGCSGCRTREMTAAVRGDWRAAGFPSGPFGHAGDFPLHPR